MDLATARARLARLCASTEAPTLTVDDLDDMLAQAARADADGRRPADDGWTPTYDLDAAAVLAWEAKAAKVAGHFSFTADGASFDKGKVLENIQAMIKYYGGRAGGGLRSTRLANVDEQVAGGRAYDSDPYSVLGNA